MLANTIFASFLIGLSAVLFLWHWQQWRSEEQVHNSDPRDARFYRTQLRRRAQASAMLGIVGLALLYGQTLAISAGTLVYWLVVVLIVLWIIVLALADMLLTRMHLTRRRNDQIVEKACQEAKRRQLRDADDVEQ